MTGEGRDWSGSRWRAGLAGAALLTAGLAKTLPEAHAEPESSGQVRALLIGIDDYGHDATWEDLHGTNDVALLRQTLEGLGVPASRIRTLEQEAATREGVLAALEDLGHQARGAHLLVHVSAHGQQVEDVDGDEGDGLDEALALYGAPSTSAGGYRGERHLLDDDLGAALDRLREQVGVDGSVTLVLDACHAASLTRSGRPVRGSAAPLRFSAPGPAMLAAPSGEGLLDAPFVEPHPRRAPLVVLSAARAGERAHETVGPDGRTLAGALSLAVARALARRPDADTWGSLYDVVSAEISGRWPDQHPVLVGPRDQALFSSGALASAPSLGVRSGTGRRLELDGGSLLGLGRGARVAIHRAGTRLPTASTRLGEGRVAAVQPLSATVELDAALSEQILAGARAFVLQPGEPVPLGISVWLAPELPDRAAWERAVSARPFVHPVQAAGLSGDRVLEATPTEVVLRPVHDLDAISARQPRTAPADGGPVVSTLSGLGRTEALRSVALHDPAHRLQAELLPARPTGPDACSIAGPAWPVQDGRSLVRIDPETRRGSSQLVLTHRGQAPTWATVVAVDGRGWTCQLYPRTGEPHARLAPGDSVSVCLTPDLDPGEARWEGELWALGLGAPVELGRSMGRFPDCRPVDTRGDDALERLLQIVDPELRAAGEGAPSGFSLRLPVRVIAGEGRR